MSLTQKFLQVEEELNDLFQERRTAIRGIILATLSRTNILFLGSAGTAKSALTNQWNARISGGRYFSWLLTKFSSPEEILGPPSLTGLKEGKYLRVTKNKLPESTTAFLDEIFKANSSILNSLLTVLNERVFYNDGQPFPLDDLVTIAGASNEIPDSDDGLDAFFDRFLLKYYLKPIQEAAHFRKMLLSTSMEAPPKFTVTIEEILEAQKSVTEVKIPEVVINMVIKLRDKLRQDGVSVTDRTFKVALRVLKAETWLNGRTEATTEDMEVFKHICWYKPDQEKTVHSIILQLISPEKNKIMTLYEECQETAKSVFKAKEAGKKQNALVEANKKIKDARVQIGKLKNDMEAKKQDTKEVEKMDSELEKLTIQMASEVLGVNIAALQKD